MKTLKNITLFVLATFISAAAFAQDGTTADHAVTTQFDDITIIDIESAGNNNDISLEADMTAFEAGAAIANQAYATNSDLWINWTVFAPEENGKYQVLVEANNDLNDGWGLNVSALSVNAQQGGGTAQSNVELNNTAKQIVSDINNIAWTGDGNGNGANIKYDLMLRDAENISSSGETITVTYTIAKQ
jgi:hypothetical protein